VRSTSDPSAGQHLRWCGHSSMVSRGALILGALVAGWFICPKQAYGQDQPPDNRRSAIRGTVVNGVTHEPIARALVYSTDSRFAMLTDSEGHFEFTPPEVSYDNSGSSFTGSRVYGFSSGGNAGKTLSLMARKPGFLNDPNQDQQTEASAGSPLTIALLPEALIKGRISISPNDAAVGINVQLVLRHFQEGRASWTAGPTTQTNSNGEFRFAELLPGAYKLVTHELMDTDPVSLVPDRQRYGFPPVCYPGIDDFASAPIIQLSAGQRFVADLSLVRKPYYSVRLPVANASANTGLNITVLVQGHRGPGYSLGYNAPEHRIEGLLPSGTYLVEGTSYGPDAASGSVDIVVAGAPSEGPAMALTRDSSIDVHVTEEFLSQTLVQSSASWSNGTHTFAVHGPRLYLEVAVEAVDDFEPQKIAAVRPPTKANDDSLVLENLAPGRYWLRLTSSRGYVASATMDTLDLLHEPFVVGPGSIGPIEITVRDDGAEIEGTVAGGTAARAMSSASPSASPMVSEAMAYVYCIPEPDSPGQFQQIQVSADGKFTSQMMAPGSYRVLAFSRRQPNLPYRDVDAMRDYDTKGQVIHLVAGQKESLQLHVFSSSK
jgi:hypothetical protein